uniref:Uncharacterized protein n=1 Tax=Opuntia streptacantha TaxID=393608 RepID=A0A7C9AIP1_OPUST
MVLRDGTPNWHFSCVIKLTYVSLAKANSFMSAIYRCIYSTWSQPKPCCMSCNSTFDKTTFRSSCTPVESPDTSCNQQEMENVSPLSVFDMCTLYVVSVKSDRKCGPWLPSGTNNAQSPWTSYTEFISSKHTPLLKLTSTEAIGNSFGSK